MKGGGQGNQSTGTANELFAKIAQKDTIKAILAELDETVSGPQIGSFVSRLPADLKTPPFTIEKHTAIIDLFLDREDTECSEED